MILNTAATAAPINPALSATDVLIFMITFSFSSSEIYGQFCYTVYSHFPSSANVCSVNKNTDDLQKLHTRQRRR
jgi:hypothetical protein